MLERRAILALSVAPFVLMTMIPSAFAFQLNALVSPNSDRAEAEYRSVQIIYIEYPEGSELKSMLENVRDEVRIMADQDTPGMSDLLDKMNKVLVSEQRSPAIVDDLKIEYKSVLKATSERALIEQTIKVDVILSNFVIQPGAYDEPALIDLNWRGFGITEPVVIQTEEYGEFDINLPSGYMYVRQPEIMSMLEKTDASRIFSLALMEYREFTDISLDKWHNLFNPIGSQAEGAQFGFQEEGGAKAVTVFSAGEGSLREGIHREKTDRVDVTIDSTTYTIRSTSPQSSAAMDILGWAQPDITAEGDEGALVFAEPPTGVAGQTATGGFPIMVLVVLGGMLAGVAGFVLWRANKK